MQARRRVEPTGTNRPIGLIALVIRVRTGSAAARLAKPGYTGTQRPTCLPNRTHAVAQPCAAKSQNPGFASLAAAEPVCVAPVWWLERRAQNPIPSRTRPLNTPAPMVLCLKTRESRSPPDPHNAKSTFPQHTWTSPTHRTDQRGSGQVQIPVGAGWSSPVARQAHNLKVTGSNPVPATKMHKARPVKTKRAFSRRQHTN